MQYIHSCCNTVAACRIKNFDMQNAVNCDTIVPVQTCTPPWPPTKCWLQWGATHRVGLAGVVVLSLLCLLYCWPRISPRVVSHCPSDVRVGLVPNSPQPGHAWPTHPRGLHPGLAWASPHPQRGAWCQGAGAAPVSLASVLLPVGPYHSSSSLYSISCSRTIYSS